MLNAITSLLLSSLTVAAAQGIPDPKLTGTWTSKSNKTITGPRFYDPVNERMIEPSHTGISYSFTDDGYYETAYYRAIPNPQSPACPSAMMQWQHGQFKKLQNGSLVLTPIAVDGRQLLSDPCKYKSSIYTRYNQSELFERYEIQIDPYHNIERLNLFRFDGSPVMPLYIAMRPPEMLPTKTLNPLTTATAKPGKSKAKRGVNFGGEGQEFDVPLNHEALQKRKMIEKYAHLLDADKWWWFGWIMTGLGGFLYFYF